ncbi:hypothetical protein OSO01_26120 [Oceanobacillus sojae]|uniref:Uncharacterized protein n=1 Tax=Oceanobacillus sojae TaxID=582851 RepID=A0A511ZK91_9BACI|nr:hypothetical protein OSO01_26120 [Oceanobacillus sojae]
MPKTPTLHSDQNRGRQKKEMGIFLAHSIWVPQRIKANPVLKSFHKSTKNNTAG